MDADKAIQLIEDVVAASIDGAAEVVFSKKHTMSKKTMTYINKKITILFTALVGRKPTKEELSKITD